MATSWVVEGSPLDDYLNDITNEEDVNVTMDNHTNEQDSSGSTQTDNEMPVEANDSRTSRNDKVAAVDLKPFATQSTHFLSPPRPDVRRHLSEDGFAERFKYLICSSALLERDYVPGLGGDVGDVEVGLPSMASVLDDRPASTAEAKGQAKMVDGADSGVRRLGEGSVMYGQKLWVGIGKRWDIGCAMMIAIGGIAVIVGLRQFIVVLVAMTACAVGALVMINRKHVSENRISTTHVGEAEIKTGITVFSPSTSVDPSSPHGRSSPPASPRQASLSTLVDLLASSRRLDNTIEKALSHLKPDPSDYQQLHALRLALNCLTSNMTDNLATATSSLLELVDKNELAVLGEMYDIPVVGSFFYSRKPLSPRHSDSEDDERTPQQGLDRSVPSPKRHRLSLSLYPPHFNQFDSKPMPQPHSSPVPFRPSHRTHHLSLSLSPRLPTQLSADDRFTSLPGRTPRIAKRSSWNSDTWSAVRSDTLAPAPDVRVRRLSRPSHERRITEADEGEEDDSGRSSTSERSASPLMSASLPASPSPMRRATTRRSPLSGSLGDPSKLPSQVNLPSPFGPTTPNTKRRSLQNMPYNPPTEVSAGSGHGLTRTRSLPFTDIQSLRSRYATGNRSRAGSLITSSPHPDVAPTPRIRRVVSVSPLTLPSLKASCLNIHLRRRRLACCLLGLRFDEAAEGYWTDVSKAMMTLLEQVEGERLKLDEAINDVAKQAKESDMAMVRPPWVHRQVDSLDSIDFAPRTSEEVMLKERIEEIRASLEKTWVDLAQVHQNIGSERLEDSWSRIRRDLGDMIRSWERGRAAVQRMSPCEPLSSPDSTPLGHNTDIDAVPDFIKTWSDEDDPGSPSTSFETDRVPASLDEQVDGDDERAGGEVLPPRGIDVVFEADVDGAKGRERSGLSREERIKMVKEARSRGLTLNEMLAVTRGGEGEEDGGVEGGKNGNEMLKQGGMVVDELRGMMDLIRAKKGLSTS